MPYVEDRHRLDQRYETSLQTPVSAFGSLLAYGCLGATSARTWWAVYAGAAGLGAGAAWLGTWAGWNAAKAERAKWWLGHGPRRHDTTAGWTGRLGAAAGWAGRLGAAAGRLGHGTATAGLCCSAANLYHAATGSGATPNAAFLHHPSARRTGCACGS